MGKHSAMREPADGYARYIGRVGALAVALGIGTAMATGHGVALAEESSSDGASSEGGGTSQPNSGPANVPNANEPNAGSPSKDSSPLSSGADPGDPPRDAPTSTVSAQTTVRSDNDPDPTPETEPAADVDEEIVDTDDADTEGGNPEEAEEADGPIPVTQPKTSAADTNRTRVAEVAVYDPTPPAATGVAQRRADEPAALRIADNTTDDHHQRLTTTTLAAPDDSTVPLASNAVTAVEPALPSSLTAPVTVRSIVADVLRWFGLAPLGANSPFSDVPLPPPLEALWFFVRRVEYTFFNDAPTTSQVVNQQNVVTGVVTGRIIAEDGDGDALTYTVTDEQNGHATVDELGNFIFTPNETTAEHGGPASFTVTVSDSAGNPLHLHGPLDLLGLVGPTTETVSMTIVNSAPEFDDPAFTIDSVDEDGVVRGHMIANDEDDAAGELTYALGAGPDPTIGIVEVTTTGQFVFTPTAKARLDALRSPTPDVAAFTVTVTDGTATDTTAVLATIDATDHAQVVSPHGYQSDGPAVVAPDGTIYQSFRSSPYGGGTGTVKIVVIDPTTATPTVIDLDGAAVGELVFDPQTGTGYQTLWTVDPETNLNMTTIAVFSPGNTTPTLHPFEGRPFRPGVLGANGTFYQGIPHPQADETTLVRVGPGGVSDVTLSGTEDGLLVVNPDTGTAYVPLQQGDQGNPLYSLAIVEPGDGQDDVTYFNGSGRVGQPTFHDGAAYQTVNVFGNRTLVIDLATSELLFEAEGQAVDPVVFGPDGTAYLVTLDPGPNLLPTAVNFFAPDGTANGAFYKNATPVGPIVFGDDGVGYLTLEGVVSNGVHQVNGQGLFYSVEGTPIGPVVFGPDGGVYQISEDVVFGDAGTYVTTIGAPGSPAGVMGDFHDITFGLDGKPIVTTHNDATFLGTGTLVAFVDGSGWQGQFFDGTEPSLRAVVGPDGRVYQLMREGGGTTVGIVADGVRDSIILIGQPESVMVGADGFVYVTTIVFDPATGGNESTVWALDGRGEEIAV